MAGSSNSWRPQASIRAISIGLIRRRDELLVMAVRDDNNQIKGWRPPGGGVEFHESAREALVRELSEELRQSVRCGKQVCVLENIYQHEGCPGHEVVFVFEAEFSDASAYATEDYAFADAGIRNNVTWRRCSEFVQRSTLLFPDGLAEYL